MLFLIADEFFQLFSKEIRFMDVKLIERRILATETKKNLLLSNKKMCYYSEDVIFYNVFYLYADLNELPSNSCR